MYHLDPNASYWFRAWATNVLGPGPPVEVLATTLYSDQDAGIIFIFQKNICIIAYFTETKTLLLGHVLNKIFGLFSRLAATTSLKLYKLLTN